MPSEGRVTVSLRRSITALMSRGQSYGMATRPRSDADRLPGSGGRVQEFDAVAAVALGRVEGTIGKVEQVASSSRPLGEGNPTDADGDPHLTAVIKLDRHLLHRRADLVGHHVAIVAGGVGHHHHELLTTVAGRQVR